MSFETSIARVLKAEGGYVFNPKDPGGETNFGITWPVLHAAIGRGIVVATGTTIKTLTRDQAIAIYRVFFWLTCHCDLMAPIVADEALDFAVNSGLGTATRKLQQALGVADDGNFGPMSQAALAKATDTTVEEAALGVRFLALRLDFMRALSSWATFGNGWTARIAEKMRDLSADLLAVGA